MPYQCGDNYASEINQIKHFNKEHDRTTLVLTKDHTDEVKQYLDACYVSAYEAIWRIFRRDLLALCKP